MDFDFRHELLLRPLLLQRRLLDNLRRINLPSLDVCKLIALSEPALKPLNAPGGWSNLPEESALGVFFRRFGGV